MVSEKSENEKKAKENKNKKMVVVNFTGKELMGNQVFDTTQENVAKENNIYNKEKEYNPLTIIIGENELHKKVEDTIAEMKEGEEKKVHLTPEEGFGERKNDLVRVVPLKTFQEQKINPVPGLMINVGQQLAKIQSVSGGRVRVDFNHPLAGRELDYDIKLEREVKDKKEIAEKMFDKYFSKLPEVEKEISKNTLYITMLDETKKGIENVLETISNLGQSLGIKIEYKTKSKKENSETKEKDSPEEPGSKKETSDEK